MGRVLDGWCAIRSSVGPAQQDDTRDIAQSATNSQDAPCNLRALWKKTPPTSYPRGEGLKVVPVRTLVVSV